MALTKISTGMLKQDAASSDLNIDAGTLYLDVSNNRVGIANTSPSQTLDVTGNATISGTITMGGLTVQTAGVNYLKADQSLGSLMIQTNGANNRAFFAHNGDISFYNSDGTTKGLTWDASAKSLGIGTSSPSQDLEILNGSTGAGIRLAATGTAYWDIERDSTSGHLTFTDDGAGTVLTVRQDGKVGIGTATFTGANSYMDDLVVYNATAGSGAGLSIIANATNGYSNIAFGDTADWDTGRIQYNHTDNSMAFHANSAERLRIDSSGNVGIGTTSPTQALDVRTQAVVGNGTDGVKLTYSTGNSSGIIDTGHSSTALEFRTGNSFAAMIDSSGNVGIGTSSPDTLLELSANNNGAASNNTLRFTDTDGSTQANQQIGKIEFKSNDSSGDGPLVRAYINCISEDVTPSSAITFATNPGGAGNASSEAMRIDSIGRVGIGTDNPTFGKLEVQGAKYVLTDSGQARGGIHISPDSSATPGQYGGAISLSGGGSGSVAIASINDGGSDHDSVGIAFITHPQGTGSADAEEKMRITEVGNVGIGTSSPVVKLHTSSGVARTSTAKTETAFFATEDDDDWRYGLVVSHKGGTTSADRYVSLESAAYRVSTDAFSAGGALVLQELGGKVGIGSTSPDAPLSVMADTSSAVPAAGAASSHLAVGKNDQYGTMIGSLGSGKGYIQQQRFDGNTTTYDLILQPNGGNVGIGSSSPLSILHIGGGADANVPITIAPATGGNVEFRSTTSTGSFTFTNGNGSSELMRIDSSGNLLVGTTSAVVANSSSNVGTAIGSGLVESARAGVVAQFNRHTSDGSIVEIQKNGTTVGSIGSFGNHPYIGGDGTNATFLRFWTGSSPSVRPSTVSGANADATLDLGSSSARWKDIYTSGGVYLGGTVAANKLDDYEEGTWSPAIRGSGSWSAGTQAYTIREGHYVKVGGLVYLSFDVKVNGLGTVAGSYLQVGNFPFTAESSNLGGGNVAYYSALSNTSGPLLLYAAAAQGYLMQGGTTYVPLSDATASTRLMGTIVYKTA